MRGLGSTFLLAVAAATAVLVAACGDESMRLERKNNGKPTPSDDPAQEDGTQASASTDGTQPATGKEYFATTVFPMLAGKCGACHAAGGSAQPSWIANGDPAKTYDLVYANSFVTPTGSRLVDKGPHAGPALADDEKTIVLAWVTMEVKDGAAKQTNGVLEKFGSCLDQAAFTAIGLEKLVTTRRTAQNNANAVQGWEEQANTCTGCDNTPCRACHSLDDATGFVLALGNPNLPANITFEETKKVVPAYLQKYVTTGQDGKPVASNGLARKSDATRKDKAYTHPMFVIPPDMQTRLDAFVTDAVTKWAAGTCGK